MTPQTSTGQVRSELYQYKDTGHVRTERYNDKAAGEI
jgi:hypothetical protein